MPYLLEYGVPFVSNYDCFDWPILLEPSLKIDLVFVATLQRSTWLTQKLIWFFVTRTKVDLNYIASWTCTKIDSIFNCNLQKVA